MEFTGINEAKYVIYGLANWVGPSKKATFYKSLTQINFTTSASTLKAQCKQNMDLEQIRPELTEAEKLECIL